MEITTLPEFNAMRERLERRSYTEELKTHGYYEWLHGLCVGDKTFHTYFGWLSKANMETMGIPIPRKINLRWK